ncbi:hypothetical protein [Pedobacter arcticus]|uniref:hypothetical protein n=1 Tax=Pedobacter arcticus TaxID=752140 RepID=UPI00047502F8|nr:hypothetical protein [Pedobacter arcticus]
MFKYFLLWFPMIVIAIINGTARDLWYKNHLSELTARQISTFFLIVFLAIYIFLVIKKYPPQSENQSLFVGLFWLILTLGFEFGFGLLRGSSWNQLLDEYNIMKGHIWILIPIWIISAPYLFFKILR